MSVRILVADDHTAVRESLIQGLRFEADVEIVAEAGDGCTAVELTKQHLPDVVFMDISMPRLNGIEATRQILRTYPHMGIIMLTMFKDDDSVFAAMRAGARGYVLKGADQDVMLRAVRAVANGESLFSPEIAERLMRFFAGLKPAAPPEVFPELTGREREILALIAQGDTNADIASALSISVKTVRNHVSNIFNKLQVADRTQASIRAREAGFGDSR